MSEPPFFSRSYITEFEHQRYISDVANRCTSQHIRMGLRHVPSLFLDSRLGSLGDQLACLCMGLVLGASGKPPQLLAG